MNVRTATDYGIDAPGLCKTFFLAGLVLACVAICWACLVGIAPAWKSVVGTLIAVPALYCLCIGCLMIYGSRVFKLAECERLLDKLQIKGDERVLDAGCGGGMMMIRAARRLSAGRAIGIDLWQASDQSRNNREKAMNNALAEGVLDRVEILTADIRRLPFAGQSFDLVLTHWVVHNLPTAAERMLAIREMQRVLKPGGKLLITDIALHSEYERELNRLRFKAVTPLGFGLQARVFALVSCGGFCPASVLAEL